EKKHQYINFDYCRLPVSAGFGLKQRVLLLNADARIQDPKVLERFGIIHLPRTTTLLPYLHSIIM
ncbi:MAG: hypothetical protein Q7W54_16025, partial [Bacteroidota bacterium]|nr:hypothetical protein [Bacteroidota bacterium]